MIFKVFCFFSNSCFSRTVAACLDSRFSIRFCIFLELGILERPDPEALFLANRGAGIMPDVWFGMLKPERGADFGVR